MEDCPFCNIEEEEIIYETKNFIIKPSLGPLVEGHILICSKEHLIGISKLPEKVFKELRDVILKTRKVFKETYRSPTVFFEHGPINEKVAAGSCVDHTHLHALPFNIDIRKDISRNFKEEFIRDIQEIKKQEKDGIPYFYYENQKEQKFLYEIKFHVPRQYLRQILASKTKFPERWDWRIHPKTNIFDKTLKKLKGEFNKE